MTERVEYEYNTALTPERVLTESSPEENIDSHNIAHISTIKNDKRKLIVLVLSGNRFHFRKGKQIRVDFCKRLVLWQ